MDYRRTLRSFLKTLRDIAHVITIEPMLFCKDLAMQAIIVPSENMKLDRFCRVKLGHSAELCDQKDDGHHEDLQVEVQKLDNIFNFYQNLIGMIVPVLLLSFIASWSDQRGRKIPILMSLFGYILHAAVFLLVSFFPSWPPEILLVASFLQTIGGGWVLFYMASYSYIADNSEGKSRTVRLAVMRSIWSLGNPAGTAIGAVLYEAAGISWVFAFTFVLYILCFIYSAIVMKDKDRSGSDSQDLPKQRSIFSPKNIVDLFRACLRKRQGRARIHIAGLMSFALACYSVSLHNMYLWSLRVFNWDINSFSLYKTINDVIQSLMLLVISPLLRHLKPHDCAVGALGSVFIFTQLLTFGMLTNESEDWIPYLFVIFPIQMVGIVVRGHITKICDKGEIGRLLAMLGVLEVFWPIVDSAIFTAVYGATIDFYPSFEHLISAAFAVYLIGGFLVLRLSLNHDDLRSLQKTVENHEELGDKISQEEKLKDRF